MRLIPLLFALTLAVPPPVSAQDAQSSSPQQPPSAPKDNARTGTADQEPVAEPGQQTTDQEREPGLPVSLDKIKDALKQPPSVLTPRSLDQTPTFRVQVQERQKIEELLATLKFPKTYVPAQGVYGYWMQRQWFPAVDNPLRQPYSAFSSGELLTILIQNLMVHYLGGLAVDAVSNAQRTHAEAQAKEEVREAVAQYCAAQPNGGAGIQICGTTIR
jgi:hypothetical protein